MNEPWTEIIRRVHASPAQCVLCVTGGGASAIGRLLSVPGGSRSILEAVVPYASQALDQWLTRQPDSYCSAATALSMASMSWSRAKRLMGSAETHEVNQDWLVGVSCTASLASDRPKKGEHRCFVATQTTTATHLFTLSLQKGARDRAAEEEVVARVLLFALADACGLQRLPTVELLSSEQLHVQRSIAPAKIRAVWCGDCPVVWSTADGKLRKTLEPRTTGLLSGAFNPLHHGHERLACAAEQKLGGPVAFEMPIVNADKPRLDYLSIETRRQQFQQRPVALTSAPLFVDKARLFPHTTFVVGFDTAARLLDARYFDGSEARMLASFEEIRTQGCRFLVAGRLMDHGFETLADLHIPNGLNDLFEGLTEAEFRDDVSSTELRQQAHQPNGIA